MDRRQPTEAAQTNTTEQKERTTKVRRYSLTQKLSAVAAGITLAGSLAACGENATATPQETSPAPVATATENPGEVEPTNQSEVEATFSDQKEQYEAFLETLTAEQKAKLDSLSPEKLAQMSSEEMRAAFAIPASEVTDESGQIDPLKYATSVTLRSQAIDMGSCSPAVFDKFGGDPLNMSHDNILQVVTTYTNNAANGMIGVNGTIDVALLERCVTVESVRTLGSEEKEAVQPYEIVEYLKPETVQFDATTNNISFSIMNVDNYDSEAMYEYTGEATTKQIATENTLYMDGLHITEQGTVLPAAATN